MYLDQIDEAKRALAEAIALDKSYIHEIGIMAQDGALSDAYPDVYEMAETLYRILQPWYKEITEKSISGLAYDEFHGIEVRGPCPFCNNELYGEMDLPYPNFGSDSIHGSEEYDGYSMYCDSCGELFEFSVFNNIVHTYFMLENSKLHSDFKWEFEYRLL